MFNPIKHLKNQIKDFSFIKGYFNLYFKTNAQLRIKENKWYYFYINLLSKIIKIVMKIQVPAKTRKATLKVLNTPSPILLKVVA